MNRILSLIFIAIIISFSLSGSKPGKEAERQIDEKRELLKGVQTEKADLVDQLDKLDKQILDLREKVMDLEKEEVSLEHSHKKLQELMVKAEVDYNISKAQLKTILVEAYKRGKASELQFLFGADDFVDLFQRYKFLLVLAENRSSALGSVAEQYKNYRQLVEEVADKEEKIKQNKNSKQEELRNLSRDKKEFGSVLGTLSKRESEYKEAIWTLQKGIDRLEQNILVNPSFKGRFAYLKGNLPWPVRGRKVMYNFGKVFEKKHGTFFVNSGIDIEATADEEIKAVAEGEIAHVGWLRGYEYVIVLKHAEGYFSLYGNLGSVEVNKGDFVTNGEILGYVSPLGWTEGPKVHFEIRKGKEKENPLEWLRT